MTWDEQERLRQLVAVRPDSHLANWARWSLTYRHGLGHRKCSSGFAGAGVTSIEDLEDAVDSQAGRVADAIIDVLPIEARMAIAAVYAGGSWRLRLDLLDSALVEAAELFWQHAKRKGLL